MRQLVVEWELLLCGSSALAAGKAIRLAAAGGREPGDAVEGESNH